MTRTNNRNGFTLIELLVAMSIIVTLAGFVLLVYPGARDQDRARNAVSDVGSTLKLAQGMALRDKAPRGVRFIVALDPTNSAKADPRFVTELQYVELPPPLIPNRKPLTPSTQNSTGNPDAEPRVRFQYNTTNSANAAGPAGTITNRLCFIENLTADQVAQIKVGCTIVMPVFGSWHKITQIPATMTLNPSQPNPNKNTRGTAAIPLFDMEVTIEVYPDANMGGGTQAQTNYFAIYLLATPLVGEPTVLLSKNICVDLSVSRPAQPAVNPLDFDVIFGPDGKLVGAPFGQLFLWVRDYTKVPTMQVAPGAGLVDAFRRGGDQHILSIRASGALGNNQVLWPDLTPGATFGTYTGGQGPFTLAAQEQNQ